MESLKWKIYQYILAHIQSSLGWYTILEFPLKLWKYLDTFRNKIKSKEITVELSSLIDMLYTEEKKKLAGNAKSRP